ncbi:hypothetical protein KZ292_28190, partial [Escherichia coli]|nr:hypothetical protein [Escherichia coli]
LVGSQEEINKKLELLFLASELYVNKKVDIGSTHLLTIMSEKEEWTFNELISHQQVSPYAIDLGILLEFLIQKEIVVI